VFGAAAWWSLFAAWSRAKTAGSAAFRGVILTGLPLLLIASTSTAPASPPERPPNIILIVTDDLGVTDLGVYGSDYHLTPRLNALAQEGMRFSSAYAASPVCSPTRAAILTGRSPHRLHLTDALPWDRLPDNPRLVPPNHWKELSALHATYAKHLRAAGYRTALYGKWHLGNEYDFFTQGRHRSYGFDEVFDASSSDINNVDKGE
jgi:arylsulfatase A-like enzyme